MSRQLLEFDIMKPLRNGATDGDYGNFSSTSSIGNPQARFSRRTINRIAR
jgi:hypothetical protein